MKNRIIVSLSLLAMVPVAAHEGLMSNVSLETVGQALVCNVHDYVRSKLEGVKCDVLTVKNTDVKQNTDTQVNKTPVIAPKEEIRSDLKEEVLSTYVPKQDVQELVERPSMSAKVVPIENNNTEIVKTSESQAAPEKESAKPSINNPAQNNNSTQKEKITKPVGWIPWIGGGVGSLFGGTFQLGLNGLSWAANTVNDTTYTFTDGFFGKDTSLSKAAARGLIFWGTTAAIKYALRFEPMVKAVEDDFKLGLKDPKMNVRIDGNAYWKNLNTVNTNQNSLALNDLKNIKNHYVFNVLHSSGISKIINDLIDYDKLKNEYKEKIYIDALNENPKVYYGINKGAWWLGLNELKDKIVSLYIRICLCERAVRNKQVSEEILKQLKLV